MSYAETDETTMNPTRYSGAAHRSTATSLAIIIYMMCATVSAMLLYGVIKSRPSYLMPFFGIQLCDFFFTLPAFMTSLYSTPANHNQWESPHGNSGWMDVKRVWPNATPTAVYTSSLLVTTCIVLFKAYFLCVVWKCYRYLKMKEMILPMHLAYNPQYPHSLPEMMLPQMMVPPSTMAPPDYEEATKSCAPPPDYESAVRIDEFKFPPPASPAATQTQLAQPQPPPQQTPQDTSQKPHSSSVE